MLRRGHRAAAGITMAVMSAMVLSACGSSMVGGAAPEVIPEAERGKATVVTVSRLSGPGVLTVGQRGARPTVVNLWASWCGPCKDEMPAVQRFASANPRVRVVGIAIDDSRDAAQRFAKELGVRFPLGLDENDRVGAAYGISGLPTTLLLDQRGRLASAWAGPVTQADLERLVAPLVGTR
jgi:cytochrome c biogenesis protein CcmG, thiol:disulfide interchange protein DsbE